MGVAETAVAAFGQYDALAQFGDVGDDRLTVFFHDFGADGDAQDDVFAIGAGLHPAHAALPVLGKEMLLVAKVDQRVQPVDGLDDDIAAGTAAAAIRSAEFDVFLTAEGHAAISTGAGANVDLC